MEEVRCKNIECGKKVDALHMDDEGYCDECHDKILDGLIIEESDDTRYLSDESLNLICSTRPIRVRAPIGAKYRSANRRRF